MLVGRSYTTLHIRNSSKAPPCPPAKTFEFPDQREARAVNRRSAVSRPRKEVLRWHPFWSCVRVAWVQKASAVTCTLTTVRK